MLIEYKIKYEKDGVTITQRVEPGASGRADVPLSAEARARTTTANAGAVKTANELPASFGGKEHLNNPRILASGAKKGADKGGSIGPETDPGGGSEPEPNVSIGPETEPGGGGGPQSGLVVIFGPIVVMDASTSLDGGGSIGPETDTP